MSATASEHWNGYSECRVSMVIPGDDIRTALVEKSACHLALSIFGHASKNRRKLRLHIGVVGVGRPRAKRSRAP